MPDTAPSNPPPPIPPKARPALAWISWALLLSGPTAGLLIPMLTKGTTQTVLTAILGLLVAAAAAIKGGLAVPWKKVGPAVLVLAALGLAGCPSGQTAAWKATGGTMYAFKAASKTLAAGRESGQITCEQLKFYRDNIRPGGRSSVAAAYATIRTVEEAKGDKVDYMAILMPGACGLVIGLREWAHKLPDKGAAIVPWLGIFGGAVCDKYKTDKPKSATTLITALLPVAVDLVKWVISLVGSDNNKIKQEINAWIQGPAADEVDAAIKKHCPAPARMGGK